MNSANYFSTGNPSNLPNTHDRFTINSGDEEFALSHLTAVGMFAGTTTAYGVYDMNGNAFSWLETPVNPFDIEGTYVRGGTWDQREGVTFFSRNNRVYAGNYDSNPNIGIRLVSVTAVPEPSAVPEIDPNSLGSVLALVLGSLGLLERRRLKAA